MRRKIGFFSGIMVLSGALAAQSPPAAVPDEPATIGFDDAFAAALQDEMASSSDPAVREFASFAKIPAAELMAQDVGYIFPQPTLTASPPDMSPVAAAAAQVAPAATFRRAAGVRAQAAGDVASTVYVPKDVVAAVKPDQVAGNVVVKNPDRVTAKMVRPHYSMRRKYVSTEIVAPNAEQNLIDWYRSQLPSQLWPGSSGAPSEYQVLFLSECWADDMPAALEDAVGGEQLPAADRPAVDRARIEIALSRAGIELSSPLFSTRMSGAQRPAADPEILALNAKLWTAYESGNLAAPTVVLEKYCGRRLPIMYSMSQTFANHYKVAVPQQLVGTYFAPFLYAETCRKKTGSRYYDSSCQRWKPMQSGRVLPGIGRYRLVGMRGDETVSYLYHVDGSTRSTAENPQTVEPTLEP